jgi:hypothetical protein
MNSTINQEEIFGKTQKVFSIKLLKQYIKEDCIKDTTFTQSKKYFLTYYAKSIGETRYEFTPSENDDDGLISNLTSKEMTDILNNFDEDYNYFDENVKPQKFSLKKWFNKKWDETYKINSDPRTRRFYTSAKTGQQYINLSKGFLHKNVKTFDSYDEKIKANVQIVIDHITNIWNSGNQECADYCLNWMAHALTGHKMTTAIFLKSGEGAGKSCIVNFINSFVIGSALGLITCKSNQLARFNSILLGKILVCLEELPTASKSQWFELSDILKDLITGSSVDIERKFQDCIQTTNLISLMIFTNNDNTIKFGKDARRYFMADVSHDVAGNSEYFKKLTSILNKETGEAFYMWLNERYEKTKNFNEAELPLTEAKLEMKNRNLTPILKFVKTNFISKKIGLIDNAVKHKMIKLNDLKDLVNFDNNLTLSTQAFNIALKQEIPICKITNYGKNKDLYIEPLEHKLLLDYFIKKGFWNDKFDIYDMPHKVSNPADKVSLEED